MSEISYLMRVPGSFIKGIRPLFVQSHNVLGEIPSISAASFCVISLFIDLVYSDLIPKNGLVAITSPVK
jgi:hypothetical protein